MLTNKKAYLIGGQTDTIETVEAGKTGFTLLGYKVPTLPTIPTYIRTFSLARLDKNTFIIAGWDNYGGNRRVLKLDTKSGTFSDLPQMNTLRSHAHAG